MDVGTRMLHNDVGIRVWDGKCADYKEAERANMQSNRSAFASSQPENRFKLGFLFFASITLPLFSL